MYITYDEYAAIYDPMEERLFNALAFDACRVMDTHTTGIDNVKKLKQFFPTEEEDAQTVKRCAAKIINILDQIRQAEVSAMEARGFESTDMGMKGKVISSVTAGNESISYSTGSSFGTAVDAAVKDRTAREKLLADTVWEYLSGLQDANGVNLLFMGMYPRRYLC